MLTINNIPGNQTVELVQTQVASNLNLAITVVRNFRDLEQNIQNVPEITAERTYCEGCKTKYDCDRYGCQNGD